MQNNFSLSSTKPKVRKIITLDAQQVTLPLFENSTITNHDNLKFTLNLNIFDDSNPLHIALANLIIDMLTTKSITYVAATTRAVKKWFNSNISQKKSLDISCLDSLNNVMDCHHSPRQIWSILWTATTLLDKYGLFFLHRRKHYEWTTLYPRI